MLQIRFLDLKIFGNPHWFFQIHFKLFFSAWLLKYDEKLISDTETYTVLKKLNFLFFESILLFYSASLLEYDAIIFINKKEISHKKI
ncbi:hypothetical protein BpHYR1_013537 [Brachionus plicatilis]|uniref:Uncharacterized protein n=1 Tax=Brachionus plicatilis TaxID=10195 RepID=A0A3M7SI69_BRAPC|nr:hypothetical protein BpHYR1_013537 [Brachionus plicatilis]